MKVRSEFKKNFGKSLYQTIFVSFHLSLFFLICSVIYLSLLFFLLLVCLHSKSILIRTFLVFYFSSGAHQGWLPESSTEPLWRRWLNICNLLLLMSSSEDFLKRLVKNSIIISMLCVFLCLIIVYYYLNWTHFTQRNTEWRILKIRFFLIVVDVNKTLLSTCGFKNVMWVRFVRTNYLRTPSPLEVTTVIPVVPKNVYFTHTHLYIFIFMNHPPMIHLIMRYSTFYVFHLLILSLK